MKQFIKVCVILALQGLVFSHPGLFIRIVLAHYNKQHVRDILPLNRTGSLTKQHRVVAHFRKGEKPWTFVVWVKPT